MLGHFRPVFWAFFFLCIAECGLEVRASRKGFRTHLFGSAAAQHTEHAGEHSARTNASTEETFGPTPDFPFRSRVCDSKRTDKLRIWIASSSHAEDVRIPPNAIFPSVLQKELQQLGIRCEILNASKAGMSIRQNIQQYERLSPTWQPDIVVVYQLANDFASSCRREKEPTHEGPKPQGLPKIELGVQGFVERTTAYELVKANLSPLIAQSRESKDVIPKSFLGSFEQDLSSMLTAANSRNADCFICTFGLSHIDTKTFPSNYKLVLSSILPEYSSTAWIQATSEGNSIIRARFAKHFDLAAVLRGQTQLYRDPVHFSAAGHQFVGAWLAQEIAENIDLRNETVER